MIETCVYTFTPVGQQIQEVKNCTMSVGASQATTTLVAVRLPFDDVVRVFTYTRLLS